MRYTDGADALTELSARQLLKLYASRDLSPVEVVEAVLSRIDTVQPQVNCFTVTHPDSAIHEARTSEARWREGAPLGPLDGVPTTIKENVATRGVAITQATRAYSDNEPSNFDGPPAARTIEAGGIIVGKTTMSEMGMLSSGVSSLHGITRNPWNLDWTVGGSSGGAAAAAVAGCGPVHSGSDIGGSLRFPATWTGLATLKPTFGRLPVDPPYMGRCVGALARTVDDVALYSSVLAEPDPSDYTSVPGRIDWTDLDVEQTASRLRGARIAYLVDGGTGMPTDPAVAALVERAAGVFRDAGASVDRLEPFVTDTMLDGLETFLSIRSWIDYRAMSLDAQKQVHPFIAEWASRGADRSGVDAVDAYQQIQSLAKTTVRTTWPYDAVLSPVSPCAVFPAPWPHPLNDPAQAFAHLAYTAAYNFSGQPAAVVNCGFTMANSPVGLQISGRRFEDLQVLRFARWYEAARPLNAVPDWMRTAV